MAGQMSNNNERNFGARTLAYVPDNNRARENNPGETPVPGIVRKVITQSVHLGFSTKRFLPFVENYQKPRGGRITCIAPLNGPCDRTTSPANASLLRTPSLA